MENHLLLMGGDFEFYCLQLKKSSGNSQYFIAFPSGDESSVQFSNGDEISGYFFHRRHIFDQFFCWWDGGGLSDTGCIKAFTNGLLLNVCYLTQVTPDVFCERSERRKFYLLIFDYSCTRIINSQKPTYLAITEKPLFLILSPINRAKTA